VASARFTKISIDAVDPAVVGPFWAAVLGLRWAPADNGEGGVHGEGSRPVLWVNRVPGAKQVKNRVHLDVYAAALADLQALGSSVVLPAGEDRGWTIMADPEGGEFCAFLRPGPPSPRLHGLVVDCTDPAPLARFWARLLGGRVQDDPRGFSTAVDVPGMPFTFDFVPVPEPKTVANRVHWDLVAADVRPLVAGGATVLRQPGGDIDWYVLADPEGNEFCARIA
jgi:Glyoxalase-like domain